MAIGLLSLAVVGLNLLSLALRPRPKGPRAAAFETPTCEEGRVRPKVYGTQAINPNVVYAGTPVIGDDDGIVEYNCDLVYEICEGPITGLEDVIVGGKSLRNAPPHADGVEGDAGTLFMDPTLPHTFSGANTPTTFEIQGVRFFGGGNREGGIGGDDDNPGEMRVYPGGLNQPPDPLMITAYDSIPGLEGSGAASGQPGVAYAVFAREGVPFFWSQNNPAPKTVQFVVRRIPEALGLGAIGLDANPAEIIYDLLGNTVYGLGKSTDLIDTAAFTSAGETLAAEGLGLSFTFAEQESVWDMIERVCDHIHATCYESPITGKITLVLARPGDASVLTVDTSKFSDLVVERPNWGQVVNHVTVKYREFASGGQEETTETFPGVELLLLTPTGLEDSPRTAQRQVQGRHITGVTVMNTTQDVELVEGSDYTLNAAAGVFRFTDQGDNLTSGDDLEITYTPGQGVTTFRDTTAVAEDLGAIQSDELNAKTEDWPGFTTSLNAARHAERRLAQLGRPLAVATFTVDRSGYVLLPGSVVSITYSPLNLSSARFRVVPGEPVDYGTLEDGRIRVTAVEDVWGLSVLPHVVAPPNDGPPQIQAPRMALACGLGGSVTRLAFFPGDTSYDIQLWSADDENGTNATLVATYPGTTEYVDDPPGGPYWAARMA